MLLTLSISITLHFNPDCTTLFQDSVYNTLERIQSVGYEKSACGCFIRITHGLSCACEFAGYQIQGEPIPLELIHVFWKKLFIEEHRVTEKKMGHNWI